MNESLETDLLCVCKQALVTLNSTFRKKNSPLMSVNWRVILSNHCDSFVFPTSVRLNIKVTLVSGEAGAVNFNFSTNSETLAIWSGHFESKIVALSTFKY